MFSRILACVLALAALLWTAGARPTLDILNSEGVPERCFLAPKQGRCRALLPRWRFDAATQDCVQFVYYGCKGNRNRFYSKAQCMDTCASNYSAVQVK